MLAGKIVKRRWRRNSPFESRSFPRVLGFLLAFEHTPEQVEDEDQLGGRRNEGGDRHEPVQMNDVWCVQKSDLRKPGVTADIAFQPQEVHGLKDAVSADEGEPEVDLPPGIVH